ncbi:hypothetical protein KUV85_12265 [Nocardioides panacisoli]|uniref:hypothetical protein n=1 Tax=Nocardioides panacisoli TaxID=627624 RepID=UPI001C6374D2|nr:hypothetical protein [Nocardioides panacisoli]QYJ03107.1 hypothetical protein KUV85_12265 [Nocardioides panacisoli]
MALVRQPDQYADDAKVAHGWAIHTYPADLDLDTFSYWTQAMYPATLTLPATGDARRQDGTCAELARLTRAQAGGPGPGA